MHWASDRDGRRCKGIQFELGQKESWVLCMVFLLQNWLRSMGGLGSTNRSGPFFTRLPYQLKIHWGSWGWCVIPWWAWSWSDLSRPNGIRGKDCMRNSVYWQHKGVDEAIFLIKLNWQDKFQSPAFRTRLFAGGSCYNLSLHKTHRWPRSWSLFLISIIS